MRMCLVLQRSCANAWMDKTSTLIENFTVSYSPSLCILQSTCHSANGILLVCAEYITFRRKKEKKLMRI